MSKIINIPLGERYGKLTVVKELNKDNRGARVWLCKCDCGNETSVNTSHLTQGSTKSCGCHRQEILRKNRNQKGKHWKIKDTSKMKGRVGELSGAWKENGYGYLAVHAWVYRWKGAPKKCESCGTTKAKKYEWANLDHKYQRILDDFIRLCTSCHRQYDIKNNNWKNR